jgi:hypothetical protein
MRPIYVHSGTDSFEVFDPLCLGIDGLFWPVVWEDEAPERTEVTASMDELVSGMGAYGIESSHHIVWVVEEWCHYDDGAEFGAIFGELDGWVLIEDEGNVVFLGLDVFVGPEDEVLSDDKLATIKLTCSIPCSLT